MTNTSGKTGIQPNNFISGLFNGDLFKKQTFSLSEVLSTSDVDAIKAYNKQINNCVTSQTAFNRTMLNTSKEAQNVVAAANGNKVALDGLTKSSKAAELGMKALAMAGNILLIYALTSVVDIIYKCATASDRLAESAAQMGSEFVSTKSDISDYKTKIKELYQTINDDTSSYEDTYNARQELLKIQDEMIDKFGDEADAVKLVTDAINGQTDSLDTLTQDKWQETVNAFNSDRGKGWTEKVADAFANIGHGNNFQRMIDEMEDTEVTFHIIPMYGDDTYEEFSKKLKEDFGADITRTERDDAITLSGDLDTIYKQLLNIQTLAKGMGIDDTFLNDLGNQADEAKSKLDEYQEMYSQHVLYDKIFNSEDYEKSFDEINKAYEKYQDAFASGDEESIEKAKQNYAEIVQSATKGLDDQSVIDYFNSMYPDLQEVVGGWEFEVKFKAAVDDDSDDFEKGVQDAVNKFDTIEDIKNYNPKVATDEQKDAYLQLKQYADEYGLTLDQLIDKLVQLGLLQSQSKSDLLNKLIPSKSSPTAGVASVLTDTMDGVDADEATKWVESLTEEEAKLANSKDFENALEEQKKKLNGASLSADDYAAALQAVKDKQNENSEETSEDSFEIPDAETLKQQISDLNSAIDSIQSAYDTLNSAVEEYNSNGGQLSIDTIQSLLSLSDEYLACLQVENGQLSLNADAMAQLAQAKLDEAQATAVTQAMTELQAIANGEAAQSTTNYITGNAALMSSLAQLSGSYEGVAQAAMIAAQAQELSAQISAAASKDKTATENVMKGLDNKLKLIQATKTTISAGNFAKVAKKSSSSKSGSSSKNYETELKKQLESIKTEYEKGSITLDEYYEKSLSLIKQYYDEGKIEASDFYDNNKSLLDDYLKYLEIAYKRGSMPYGEYFAKYLKAVQDCYDKGAISTEEYWNYNKELLDDYVDSAKKILDNLYDHKSMQAAGVSDLKQYLTTCYEMIKSFYNQGKISAYDYYNYLSDFYDYQISIYDKVIDAVTNKLDDQIDALEKQKDQIEKNYKAQIDVLEKEKDALEAENDARQDAIDLQKALYEMNRAQNQRTDLVYKDGQMVYVADQQGIRDKKDELDDLEYQRKIKEIEKRISSLEKTMDSLTDGIDQQIEDLNNYKDQWEDVKNKFIEQQNELLAEQIVGKDWEIDIQNMRMEALVEFTNKYIAMQQAQADAAVAAANKIVEAQRSIAAMQNTTPTTISTPSTSNSSSGGSGGSNKNTTFKSNNIKAEVRSVVSPGYKTSGEASSKISSYNGNGVMKKNGKWYVYKKYASGTDNAEKGWHIVSEDNIGDEIVIDNNGNAVIPHGEQLYNFQGGEQVIPANESKEIIENQGNVEKIPTKVVLGDGTVLTPVSHVMEISDSIRQSMMKNVALPNNIGQRNYENLMKNANSISNVNNNQPTDNSISIGEIHLNDVQNVDALTKGIIHKFPGKMRQALYSR